MTVSPSIRLIVGGLLLLWAAAAQGQSIVPAKDETPARVPALRREIAGQHPRLLFTADDLPGLRQKIKHPDVKPFWDQVLNYLPACNPPKESKYLTDATDAQRQGLWRLPTLSVHYAITGDRKSFDRAVKFLEKLLDEPSWETGREPDMGMAAANLMVGAAIAYDCLYNDLPPEFRQKVRDRLLLQARRLYYGGHLMKAGKTHYWQQDPHNNHRWHRNAGLALAVLAIADEKTADDDWILAKTVDELRFIHQWLPEDGSSHESPTYLVFGGPYLTLAFDAADRCLGGDLMQHPFFRHTATFRLQSLTPGLLDGFSFGDGAGFGGYNNYNFRVAGVHRQADENAGLLQFYRQHPGAFDFGWMSVLWFDPAVPKGAIEKLSKRYLADDVGVAWLRDSWQPEGVAAMFKCGLYGGRTLNEFRNANRFKYINVAHDDPDANVFVLWANQTFVAENDRYSNKKLTSNHNTILVNGAGQKGEGAVYTQPLKGDMTKTARITQWIDGGEKGVTLIEGEAANLYDGLSSYRRTVIWSPGGYVLLLDSIVGSKSNDITWLMQSGQVGVGEGGRFTLKNGAASCAMHVASDQPYESAVVDSTADHRGKPLGWKQLQLKQTGKQWRLASAFDPWQRDISIALTTQGQAVQIIVTGGPIRDTYTWTPAGNVDGATSIDLNTKPLTTKP